jgi:predicted nucleic-acid-binding Zn-ribbon protein
MKRFNPYDPFCKKCGYSEMSPTYLLEGGTLSIQPNETLKGVPGMKTTEYLLVTCGVCGYEKRMHCCDAKSNDDSQDAT